MGASLMHKKRTGVLYKSWYNRLVHRYFFGKVPICCRCGGEMLIGDMIHRGHGCKYYHIKCYEDMFVSAHSGTCVDLSGRR
jgi:hypothetical protein